MTLPELSGRPCSSQSSPIEKNTQFCQRCCCSTQLQAGLASAEVPIGDKAKENNPDLPSSVKIIVHTRLESNPSTPAPRNASLLISMLAFPLVNFTSHYYCSIKTVSSFQTDEELTCAYQVHLNETLRKKLHEHKAHG